MADRVVKLRILVEPSGIKSGATEARAEIAAIAATATAAGKTASDGIGRISGQLVDMRTAAGGAQPSLDGLSAAADKLSGAADKLDAVSQMLARIGDGAKSAAASRTQLDSIEASVTRLGVATERVGGMGRMAGQLTDVADAARDTKPAIEASEAALNSWGETEQQAAARISAMVKASLDAQAAMYSEAQARAASTAAARESIQLTDAEIAARQRARVANDAMTASATEFLAERGKLEAMMATEAQTLDEIAQRREAYAAAMERGTIEQGEHAEALDVLEKAEKRVNAELEKSTRALDAMIKGYAPAEAALERLAGDEEKLSKALADGVITQERYASAMAGLKAQRAEWQAEQKSVEGTAGALDQLNLSSKLAMNNYASLMRQVASGDWSGASRSIMSTANSTGALRLAMGGLVGLGGVLAGMLGLVAVAAAKAYIEHRQLEAALIATGSASGLSGANLELQVNVLGRATGEYGKARAAIGAFVSSGKVSGEALIALSRASVALSEITSRSVSETVSEISRLTTAPAKTVVDLNEKYHFLTLAVYEQVAALEKQGRVEDATRIAADAAAKAFEDRQKTLVDSAGAIEKGYNAIAKAAGEAWEAIKRIGNTSDAAQMTEALIKKERFDMIRGQIDQGGMTGMLGRLNAGPRDSFEADRKANEELIASIQKRIDLQAEAAAQTGAEARIQAAGISAADRIDATTASLDKQFAQQQKVNQAARDYFAIWQANPDDQRVAGMTFTDGAPQGDAWESRKRQIIEASAAYKDLAKDQRDVERASNAQEQALGRLADITDTLDDTIDPVEKAWADYAKTMRDIDDAAAKATEAQVRLGEAGVGQAAIAERVADAQAAATAARERALTTIARERDVTGRYLSDLQTEARLIGMTTVQQRAEQVVLRALADAKKLNAEAGREVVTVDEERIRTQATLNAQMQDRADAIDALIQQFGQKSPFEQMSDDITKAGEALEKAFGEGNTERIKQLTRTVGELRQQQLLFATDAVGQGIDSLKMMASEGSKAYKALEVAQAANNLVAAIGAIVNQGNGDPYTAFARMAAMAAAVSQLVGSIGSFGSGTFSDTAAKRQAVQGTGTVLGDADAKSESILNAVEITADATSKLVGLQRGMLNALLQLQSGLGSAAGMLARGAGDADFSGQNLAVGSMSGPVSNALDMLLPGLGTSLSFDPIFKALFGGKSKVTDQGIIIFGGAMSELLESIAVGAYQEVKSRSWRFGSTRTREGITDVSDAFEDQFQLIINSIGDTVRQGALALGMLPAEIDAAMAAYKIEDIRISLKGLSAEEQQAELTAVFSQIFDGLAGGIVPFIGQFQRVGEGLGETLVRVATGVQVTREAVRYLGFALDETDPERFAQISEGLLELTGGVDGLIEGMTTFMDAFASEGHRMQVATDSLTSAFEESGLTIPETREAMWDLMQSLDATTESGRAQIATLLRLAGVADEYYRMIEKAVTSQLDYISQVSALETELQLGGGFNGSKADIEGWARDAEQSLNAAARAAGRTGAAERDLSLVRDVALQRMHQLMERLMSEAQDVAVTLGYISAPDTIDSLNSAIEALSGSASASASAIGAAVDMIRSELDLLLGDLSPYNDRQKLELAREGLQAGEITQEQFLEIAQRLFGSSTNRYRQEFEFARQYPGSATGGTNTADAGQTVRIDTGDGRSLAELIAARDELLEAQRGELAQNLASRIAELSYARRGEAFDAVADRLGFDLEKLGEDLGLDGDALTDYLQSLSDRFAAADFSAAGDLITGAIYDSRDAIVAAITGASLLGDASALPSYDVGTARVRGDQIAQIHDGEMILPRSIAEIVRDAGATDDSSAQIAELTTALAAAQALLAQIAQHTAGTAANTAANVAETAEAAAETRELRREISSPRSRFQQAP